MARKYDKLDATLLAWLRENHKNITTGDVCEALAITCPIAQRHISRRFTLLQDRKILTCTLKGTLRICDVDVARLPEVLHKGGSRSIAQHWRKGGTFSFGSAVVSEPTATPNPSPAHRSIRATTSDEFIAAGGEIEVLPSRWDHPLSAMPLGPQDMFEALDDLD